MSLPTASGFTLEKLAIKLDEKLFLLTTCQVTLLTEQEAVNQEGKRFAAGKGNPLAKEFADQFTAQFADAAKVKPVYRELENLYRAVAIVCRGRRRRKRSVPVVFWTTPL